MYGYAHAQVLCTNMQKMCDGALHGPYALVGTHIETIDDGYGRDGALHGPHALVGTLTLRLLTTGTGVTGLCTGPMPS